MSSTRATGPNRGRRRQHSEDGDHELTVKSVVHMTPGSALARTRAEGPVAFNARGSTLVPSVEPGPPEHLGAPGSGHPPLAGRFVDSADCLFLFVEQWVLHHRTLAIFCLHATPVFFSQVLCPLCRLTHEWFAKDAWICDLLVCNPNSDHCGCEQGIAA